MSISITSWISGFNAEYVVTVGATAFLFRFADDFLACFQYRTDAEAFLESLGERMAEFHLELAEEKTRHL